MFELEHRQAASQLTPRATAFYSRMDSSLPARRHVVWSPGAGPRRDDQRRLAPDRRPLHLCSRLSVLLEVSGQSCLRPRSPPRNTRRTLQQRSRLRADESLGVVRPSLCRHRGSRPARRPGAGGPVRIPSRNAVARHRRRAGRRGPGLHDPVLLAAQRREVTGQRAKQKVSKITGVTAMIAVLAIMIILLAVLALIVVNALRASPWGLFTIACTIPIALLMGWWMKRWRPGKVGEASIIGALLLLLALVGGGSVASHPGLAAAFTHSGTSITGMMIAYGFIASVLPVWMLLCPRDYLSTFLKITTVLVLGVAILIILPPLKMPALTPFATAGGGPVFAGKLFPFAFITIACGAISGFHSLVASGTTPKMITRETDARMIGYGGMIMESFVG